MDAGRIEEIENFILLTKRDIAARRMLGTVHPADAALKSAAGMLLELLAQIERLEREARDSEDDGR